MGPLDLLNHCLNFLAPALWLALLLPLTARLLLKTKGTANYSLLAQVAIQFSVAVLVLALGLWFFGHDGQMTTYIGVVLLCASSQWLMQRGWRN